MESGGKVIPQGESNDGKGLNFSSSGVSS